MADDERVMIYATGHDMGLREMCWGLLGSGLAIQADLLDRASIYLRNGDKPKVGHSGRAVTVVCPRAKLDDVLAMMKQLYSGDDLAAYAMPILASIP